MKIEYTKVGDYYLPNLDYPVGSQTDWLLGNASEGISEST